MAPKAPSDKALERALEDAVQSIFDSDERADLTVNYVRQVAEKKLGLKDGFFKSDDWKARSKEVARKAVDKAEAEALSSQQSTGPPKPDSDDAESEPTPRAKPKAKPKQKAKPEPKAKPKPNPKAKSTKKRKAAASEDKSESTSSDLSDLSETSDSDSDASSSAESSDPVPKRKRTQTKAVARGKKRKTTDDEDEDDGDDSSASDSEPKHPKKKAKSEAKPKPVPKKKGEQKEKTPVSLPASGSESSLSDAPTRETAEPEAEPVSVAKVGAPIVDEESEMSEVFDEPPKRKGKGAKAAKGEPKTKKEPKTKAKSDKADFSPQGSLIRQLQMQLNKCGVRKVWGVLLKKYGDDKSAKIQHLKGMLSEVGMTGRFSESKAREIKERRELEADLGEVIEGEKSWGWKARPTRRGAAATRARKVSSSGSGDEEENSGGAETGAGSGQSDDGESDDDDGQAKPRTRGPAKHRAALAFLGTDSESE